MSREAIVVIVMLMCGVGLFALALETAPAAKKVKADAKKIKKIGEGAPDAEKLGWRLGCQAYTFRRVTFFDAIDRVAALGLKVIEAYPGKKVNPKINTRVGPNIDAATVKAIKDKLKSAGVKLVNYGVTGIPGDEAKAREFFKWCKMMGIETIVTESNHKFLDKLCEEFKMKIAFHNHPNSWPPDKVLAATKGRSKSIGACADNGHWMRKGLNLLESIKKLKGRIVSFHFKDLNKFGRGHHCTVRRLQPTASGPPSWATLFRPIPGRSLV